jgi:hypothetical protein
MASFYPSTSEAPRASTRGRLRLACASVILRRPVLTSTSKIVRPPDLITFRNKINLLGKKEELRCGTLDDRHQADEARISNRNIEEGRMLADALDRSQYGIYLK